MLGRPIIGVFGGGNITDPRTLEQAERLGELIAERGWVLLNGGRRAGIMEASARGAKRRGGLVIGILPTRDESDGGTSEFVDLPIYTGMGDARNVINVLSCDAAIVLPGEEGTLSEAALALKNGKPVILLRFDDRGLFTEGPSASQVRTAADPEEAIRLTEEILAGESLDPLFAYTPIGKLRTPYKTPEEIPKALGEPPVAEGVVEIDPRYEAGLLDIDGFSHLLLFTAFHQTRGAPLRVVPPGQTLERGVFATRSPHRPNAIGILTVELLKREGNRIDVRGVDMLDGTPVLDIKPYLQHFDCRPEARAGWTKESS